MKGYIKITKELALEALNNRNNKKDIAVVIRDRALALMAKEKRASMSFIKRYLYRNRSDYYVVSGSSSYLQSIGFWKYRPHVTDEEFKILTWYLTEDSYLEGGSLRNLVEACEDGYIWIDHELSKFISLNKSGD